MVMSKLDTNHIINLDLVKNRVNSVMKFGLADVETSDFYLVLYNNGTRVFDRNYIVTLYIVKPNGTFRNIELEPKEGLKRYYCNLPDTLKNIPGEYVCQAVVFDNLTGEKKISKSKFKYSVDLDLASEMAGIIDGEEQESILNNILNRLLTLENPVEPYATQKDVDECVSTLTEEIDTIEAKDVEQDNRLDIAENRLNDVDNNITGVNQRVDNVATLIPTNTSQLTNDSDFATNANVNEKIANAQLGGRYVTKEIGNANQITFSDGETFQAKLDAGILKGEKGDTGAQGDQGEPGVAGANGQDGADGATFTPSVDAEGNLSWSNDKGLVNPPTVNIKGEKGDSGVDSIDDNNASLTTTYSSNKIETIKEDLSSQIKKIENDGVTTATVEAKVQSVIDEKIADGTMASLTIADGSITKEKLDPSIKLEIEDGSIILDKIKNSIQYNLYDNSLYGLGSYGSEDGVVWSTSNPTDSSRFITGFIEIEPNTTYYIYGGNSAETKIFADGDSDYKMYASDHTTETGSGRYYYYNDENTITTSSDTKYIRFNMKKDKSHLLYISKNKFNGSYINGYNIPNLKFKSSQLIDNIDLKNIPKIPSSKIDNSIENVFDISKNIESSIDATHTGAYNHVNRWYWYGTGSIDGDFLSYKIEIEEGIDYYVQGVNASKDNECRALFCTADGEYSTIYDYLNTNANTFNIPVGTGIKYIRVPVKSGKLNEVMVLKNRTTAVDHYVPYGTEVEGLVSNIKESQIEYDNLQQPVKPHRFYGAKVNTLGDSLTAPGKWQAYLKDIMGFSEIRNYGVGGTTVTSARGEGESTFRDRAPSMDDDADLIIVFTSINDNGAAYGTYNSTDVSTVGGAGNVLATMLREKYPHSDIIFTSNPHTHWEWSFGACDMYKEVCRHHSIPFCDLLGTCGIDGTNDVEKSYYYSDGIHPTDAGQYRIAQTIAGFLRTL